MQTFLVFGITGDLMKKKGIPALFALYKSGVLPKECKILGFSRKEWNPETIEKLVVSAVGAREEAKVFARQFQIIQGEATNASTYTTLMELAGSGEKLIYLCVSPELYSPIIQNLSVNDFLRNARVLIEKPFGKDGASAKELEEMLHKALTEEQIYRIDHYLAKEGTKNLISLNLLPEHIAGVEVYLLEKEGVEERGAVYDAMGALRDVGQNHMLEIAMIACGIRRVDGLRVLHTLSEKEVASNTKRAQYDGYTEIEGVKPGSTTETYFFVQSTLSLINDVEITITLEAGKKLRTPRKEVLIRKRDLTHVSVSFDSTQNEYETLFSDALKGEKDRFVSGEEIELLWKFIDPIQERWGKGIPPLAPYIPDTDSVRGSYTI